MTSTRTVTAAIAAAPALSHDIHINPISAPHTVQLPACATEDAAGPCVWDAARQGNGQGRSFTVDANGAVTYIVG